MAVFSAPRRAASQAAPGLSPDHLSPEDEDQLLKETVAAVGNSPIEFVRAMERHLRLHPKSPRKDDLEKSILRAAVDARDNARIISYGEKILAHDQDPTLLDRVARALLSSDDAAPARRSLQYSERLEKSAPDDATRARALSLQARAWGNAGNLEKAIALARRSYEIFPNSEAANEAARWELKLGRLQEALNHYADAFSTPDARVTDESRKHYRAVMGEIYTKIHDSEAGLGDFILKAYDRTSRRAASQAAAEPVGARRAVPSPEDAFEFPLPGLQGDSIHLSDFSGKVLVLDFWATWCVPCRVEHPILEKLKAKYKNQDVVFLSINTDENRSLVKPFIEEQQWSNQVYFEGGLSSFYRITSIPTTMVFNKRKELVTRLPGFIPTGFQELLAEKIEQARKE